MTRHPFVYYAWRLERSGLRDVIPCASTSRKVHARRTSRSGTTTSYLLFALLPARTIDVAGKCPHVVSAIYEEVTFVDGVIDFFTLSLVSARSTRYQGLTGQNESTKQ